MRFKPFLATLTLLLLLAQSVQAERTPRGIGLCFGEDHAYFLTAPEGWVLDTESGAPQGVYAVFYPNGSSWSDSQAVMYSNAAGREGRTPEAAIQQDVTHMKKENPTVKVNDGGALPTSDGKTALVRYFSGDSFGNYEAVAYVLEKQTVANIVLNARNKHAFESALPAFRKLVSSYKFVTDKPQSMDLHALVREAHATRPHPQTMEKIVVKTVDPDNSSANTQTYWRGGLDYMRVEASHGGDSDVRTLAIIDEPDIWAIDNEKKVVQHVRDLGPYFGAGAPIFGDIIEYPDGQGKGLEYGHEVEYFNAHNAKQLPGGKDSLEQKRELHVDDATLTLTAKNGIPVRLSCDKGKHHIAIDYVSIESMPFRQEMFTPPTGMQIVDTAGRAEGKM